MPSARRMPSARNSISDNKSSQHKKALLTLELSRKLRPYVKLKKYSLAYGLALGVQFALVRLLDFSSAAIYRGNAPIIRKIDRPFKSFLHRQLSRAWRKQGFIQDNRM